MICKKKETRTIFDLFDEYNCEDCKYYCDYEEIKIGYNSIRIYYMGRCELSYSETIDNKRAKILLKDICINEYFGWKNYIFLWLNYKNDLSEYIEWFSEMMDYGYKIIIIA